MDADLALDIAQEAFLRLWKSWEEGEVILNPRAWVLRVARNLAEDAAKSSFRRNGTQPPEQLNGVHGHEPSAARPAGTRGGIGEPAEPRSPSCRRPIEPS